MTFHNEELQKTSSLNFVFPQLLLVWQPGKKGSLEEIVLLSNNNNKLPFRLVCVLVYPLKQGKESKTDKS